MRKVDHICYLVIAIVNCIDVSDVEKKCRSTAGNPAYSRRMLLRLVIMTSIDAMWSSRKIAKQAQKGKKVEDSQYSKINMKFRVVPYPGYRKCA